MEANELTPEQRAALTDMDEGFSPTLGKWAEAMAKAQAEMKAAAEDKENPHYKSSYADLASVNDAAKALNRNGITITGIPTTPKPGLQRLKLWLIHSSGEYMWGRCTFPVAQQTAQAHGSAMTYLRRYMTMAMANVVTADDDGEAASAQPPRQQQAPPRQAELLKPAEPTAEDKKAQAEKATKDKRRRRASKVWDVASKKLGMDVTAFRAWVEKALGAFKESSAWDEADLDKLEDYIEVQVKEKEQEG